MTKEKTRPEGLAAIDREMARQHADALASFEAAADMAAKAAASLKRTRRLLLLGMGGSHAVNRAVEPLYRHAAGRNHEPFRFETEFASTLRRGETNFFRKLSGVFRTPVLLHLHHGQDPAKRRAL